MENCWQKEFTSLKFKALIDDFSIELNVSSDGEIQIASEHTTVSIDCKPLTSNSYSLILDGKSHYLCIDSHPQGYEVTIDQYTNIIIVKDEQTLLLEDFGMVSDDNNGLGEVYSQIPGLITHFFVSKGDKIDKGDKIYILEAMKMENEIKAPISGTVSEIHQTTGVAVEKGTLILEIQN